MSDDRFGVVVDARRAWANAEELRALGARCVRAVIDDFDRLDAVLRGHPAEVKVIVTLDTGRHGHDGSRGDFSRWDAAVRELAARFDGRVWALECLSAWDTRQVSPATAAECARRAARTLRAAGSEIRCLLGSVSGPDWMTHLHAAAQELTAADRGALAGACYQPYGKNARGFPGFEHGRFDHGEIDVAVQNAYDLAQLPIWVTEFGVTLGQAGGETGQSAYVRNALTLLGALPSSVLAAATYYCWWDPIGEPHERGDRASGLRQEDLRNPSRNAQPRQAWYAFAEVAGGSGAPPNGFDRRPVQLCV